MTSALHHPTTYGFGLHASGFCRTEFLAQRGCYRTCEVFGRILGWISGIGIILGCIHVYDGFRMVGRENATRMEKQMGWSLIARGTAEFFCFGPLLLIVDLIFTFGRSCNPYVPPEPPRPIICVEHA